MHKVELRARIRRIRRQLDDLTVDLVAKLGDVKARLNDVLDERDWLGRRAVASTAFARLLDRNQRGRNPRGLLLKGAVLATTGGGGCLAIRQGKKRCANRLVNTVENL